MLGRGEVFCSSKLRTSQVGRQRLVGSRQSIGLRCLKLWYLYKPNAGKAPDPEVGEAQRSKATLHTQNSRDLPLENKNNENKKYKKNTQKPRRTEKTRTRTKNKTTRARRRVRTRLLQLWPLG
mmetsp:Transcript_43673/g.94089  ORF Transcript_43673/g.94089 Transcript_43673/m.94089 type:complete len:123 (-) Transcript_43673:245-613(-)